MPATSTVAGNNITDPEALILDAAFPAVFAALLAPQLSGRSARYAAIAEGTIAGLTVPILPAGLPIVAAVVAGLTATLAPADRLSDS